MDEIIKIEVVDGNLETTRGIKISEPKEMLLRKKEQLEKQLADVNTKLSYFEV